MFRCLAEELAPQLLPHLKFGRAVFVGCTNAGTLLAEPENWETLVNIYTNLIANAAKIGLNLAGAGLAAPLTSYALKTLGRFVQMLSEIAISERRLPGLAAMEPDGETVKRLNSSAATAAGSPEYYVVASNFEPGGPAASFMRSAALQAADKFADALMREGNDLVVHTDSMANFGTARSARAVQQIGVDEHVFHTSYFAAGITQAAITRWLLDQQLRTTDGGGNSTKRSSNADTDILEAVGPQTDAGDKAVPKNGGDVGLEDFTLNGKRGLRARPARRVRRGMASIQGAEPPPEAATVERFIAAEMEPFPKLERKVSLYVTVSPSEISIGDHAAAATIDEAVTLRRDEKLTILLMAARNCTVDGEGRAEIDLTSDDAEIRKFALRGIAKGEAEVRVEARQGMRLDEEGQLAGGQLIASFLLKPVFISAEQSSERIVQLLTEPTQPAEPTAVLRIYEFINVNKDVILRFDLGSDNPPIAVLQDVTLSSDFRLQEFSAGILQALDDAWNLNRDTYDSFLATFLDEARVRTAELIPERIRKALWANRKAIGEVQVISEEAYIPWELMCLFEPDGADPGEKPQFLAEWGLTRWLHNVPPPRGRIDLSAGARYYVVPDYAGDNDLYLASAQAERDMLELRMPGIAAVEPSSIAVRDLLSGKAKDGASLLHFACHGVAAQGPIINADLILGRIAQDDSSRKEDRLKWQTIKANADFGTGTRPLVFINACQTGKPGQSIAGVAGFAEAFLRPQSGRGAAGFIGALWSVDDTLATVFSDTVYTALLAGRGLNEAVKAARKVAQAKSDFSWLAYSVYGG